MKKYSPVKTIQLFHVFYFVSEQTFQEQEKPQQRQKLKGVRFDKHRLHVQLSKENKMFLCFFTICWVAAFLWLAETESPHIQTDLKKDIINSLWLWFVQATKVKKLWQIYVNSVADD